MTSLSSYNSEEFDLSQLKIVHHISVDDETRSLRGSHYYEKCSLFDKLQRESRAGGQEVRPVGHQFSVCPQCFELCQEMQIQWFLLVLPVFFRKCQMSSAGHRRASQGRRNKRGRLEVLRGI